MTVVFSNSWGLKDYDKQTSYIYNRVTYENVKRCRVKGRPSRVLHTMKYTVLYDSKVFQVCRTAFLSIHGVSEKHVRVAMSKGSSTGTVEGDKRGESTRRNKVSDDRRQLVRDHINTLPTVTSHHSRAKSPHRLFTTRVKHAQAL